ncbi:MAG: metallophosphoesterase [Ignavibacteriales bacterium]|nr:metallophosphoesterase [Ignavibacteriales bacterium]
MIIYQISDLHLSQWYYPGHTEKLRKIIKYISENGFDHLVITGDISDNAMKSDFDILKNLLIQNKIYDSQKVTITIGNHDIFGGIQRASDVLKMPEKYSKINYSAKVKYFKKEFRKLFKKVFWPDRNSFVFSKKIHNVLFVGINSIDHYSKIKNPFASNGKITKKELSALNMIFQKYEKKNLIRIVLMHHHLYKNGFPSYGTQNKIWRRIENFTLSLRKRKKLINYFNEKKVNYILHGHSHEIIKYKKKNMTLLNCGGCVLNGEQYSNIFKLTINSSGIKSEIITIK